uniref:Uncharacterized protein n=1 Tax=Homalodisca liturata TaxID=320908 RepID=A0A1B6HLW1_9HEMI
MASAHETTGYDTTAKNCEKSLLDNLFDNMEKLNLIEQRDNVVLPEHLKTCESPFLWHTYQKRGLGSELVIARNIEKLEELNLDEPGFSMQRYITLLKLVFEYYVRHEDDKAWETMKTIEERLEKEASDNNADYNKTKLSLGHVVTSTKVHLLAMTGEEEKACKISKDIIPTNIMSKADQAALNAMKARFFLYSGYENGESVGVGLMRKACELEPDNPELKYLLAKVIRQERKDVPYSMDIPREELILLEDVVSKSRNQKYVVYLAQVYRECGAQGFKQYRNKEGFYNSPLYDAIEDMYDRSLKLYKEAYDMSSDSPSALRRIGYGIMNLPKKFTDYNFALKCLLRSLELSENMMTLHVLGTFYHRYGNDNVKALEYFEKTTKKGSHAGLSDMIRVKYILNPEYNPCEDLESGLKWEIKKKNRLHLLAQFGAYFLLVRRNVPESIKYFSEIVDDDKDTPHMQVFKSFFLRMYEPINLYEYIINEALLLLEKAHSSEGQKDSSLLDDKDTDCVKNFVSKLSEIFPEMVKIEPDPHLVDRLHQTSKEIIQRENKKCKESRNDFRPSNRGGFSLHRERGRARGGIGYHQRGRGASYDVSSERRGRYSVANQRDKGGEGSSERPARDLSGGHSDRKERRGSNRGKRNIDHTNWRQRD